MVNPPGSFWVASWNSSLIIKVQGLATQRNSIFFKEFVEEMLNQGFTEFIIDLCECRGMDSTFLGVLVGIANCAQEMSNCPVHPVTLINTNQQHIKTLKSLGLLCILRIKEKSILLPQMCMKKLAEIECNSKARLQMIREAHECLAKLNEQNQQQFGQFLELLSHELGEEKSVGN